MQYNPEEYSEILNIFKAESEEIIQEINDNFLILEKNTEDKAPLKKLFQLAHSLKSAARMIGFNSIQDIAHKLEDILTYWKNDSVKINPDFFEEIYKICDFIGELIVKSVEKKGDYYDEKVMIFIKTLDNFINDNNIVEKEDNEDIIRNNFMKSVIDIKAIMLELIFVLERNGDDTFEDFISVIKDNLIKLKEIFAKTEYSSVKNKIDELITFLSEVKESDFNLAVAKAKVIDLNSAIYSLYKELNIKTTNYVQVKKNNQIQQKARENVNTLNLINSKFDYVLSNLQRIKYEKKSINLLVDNLNNIIVLSKNNKIELILTKTINILKLFSDKDILIDNDCYMVILQCVYLAKRLSMNEKEENINNLNFLIQRLSVVEDMFNISDINLPSATVRNDTTTAISANDFSNLNKNMKSFDFQEIKTLRVDTAKIDNLISQTGELLINGIKTREHIVELSKINSKLVKWSGVSKKILNYLKYLEKRGFFEEEMSESALAFYRKAQAFFTNNTEIINDINNDFNTLYNIISEDDNKLHQTVMEIESIAKGIRVLPLATIFHSFPRMIRDIAKEKNKKIDFLVSGSDTTVDKKIIEEIKMPLIHIIRNAVSHGIEASEVRKQNGKNDVGIIKMSARQVENNVIIQIEDDGYGINLIKVRDCAVKKGILSFEEAENMNAEQLMKLLFLPGFTTDESVSDISGRGIGLDIVKSKISNLNGEIFIDSELNKGCRVTIKIPVSMSTIKTFILKVNNEKYAIPINAVKYVKIVTASEIFNKNGKNCILFDNQSIPIYNLNDIYGSKQEKIKNDGNITVIIIENQEKQAAFITEQLVGSQEVFHKKLIQPIMKIKNISGFTTLSTGEICLIINPYELIRNTVINDNFVLTTADTTYVEDKEEQVKKQKVVILNTENSKLNNIKEDLQETFDSVNEFNNVNSIYDYIIKNEVNILICEINEKSDDVIRLIKYLKSDENYGSIKLVIFSDLTEYEMNQEIKDYGYNMFEKYSQYKKADFVSKILKL